MACWGVCAVTDFFVAEHSGPVEVFRSTDIFVSFTDSLFQSSPQFIYLPWWVLVLFLPLCCVCRLSRMLCTAGGEGEESVPGTRDPRKRRCARRPEAAHRKPAPEHHGGRPRRDMPLLRRGNFPHQNITICRLSYVVDLFSCFLVGVSERFLNVRISLFVGCVLHLCSPFSSVCPSGFRRGDIRITLLHL